MLNGIAQKTSFLAKDFAAALLLLFVAAHVCAGELEPRSYVNTPVDLNFLIAGYSYSEGGLSINALPISDAQLKIDTEYLAYAHTLNVGGNSGKFDVILPHSNLSGSAQVDGLPRERDVSGLHDPRFRFSVNFYGAPALSLQEFADYKQDLLIGASVQVSAPLGQYDSSKLINLGTNRWYIKPDIGISKSLGAFALELSEGVTFFSRNDDFYGGKTLEQDPVYTSQAHLTYDFGHGVWGALDAVYDYGGRTTVNGVQGNDVQKNSRFGATLALPVNRKNSVKLFGSSGVSTRTGSDYDLWGIAWQHRWGGGL